MTSIPPGQRIAVIGAGVSGLVAAYLLRRRHDVTLFEANDYVGGHTHTHTLDATTANGDSSPVAVDSGFIVFNELTYPNFVRLLNTLEVPYQDTPMSFSVQCEASGLEYNGTSINTLFAQRRNLLRPSFYRMIRDILRFGKEALELLDDSADSTADSDVGPTLGEYLRDKGYSTQFRDHYILPMASALWSGPLHQVEHFPARYFVQFFKNHRMLKVEGRPQWKVVQGGSQQYVKALTRDFGDSIHLQTPIRSVRRKPDSTTGPNVDLELASGERRSFDHVVLATHSDQSLRMLADPTDNESSILGAMHYQQNDVLLHSDPSVLPKRRLAWAAWNYHIPKSTADRTHATVTYDMNILQSLRCRQEYCVTLNDTGRVDAARVARRMTYHHPIYTQQSVAAQARFDELDHPKTHFCGAYWGWGFHEDGVRSALRVAHHFGEDLA